MPIAEVISAIRLHGVGEPLLVEVPIVRVGRDLREVCFAIECVDLRRVPQDRKWSIYAVAVVADHVELVEQVRREELRHVTEHAIEVAPAPKVIAAKQPTE